MAIEDELYQEIILEHYRATENRRKLAHADYREVGDNPACGDRLELFVNIDQHTKKITAIAYGGNGCSICCASANMLCAMLRDTATKEAEAVRKRFRSMLVEQGSAQFDDKYEDLEAMEGIKKFPTRIKCALLPWSALNNILKMIHQ